jgi:hypothetical protein
MMNSANCRIQNEHTNQLHFHIHTNNEKFKMEFLLPLRTELRASNKLYHFNHPQLF